jgi:GNAT superfamily N-acetyltransferase
MAKKTKPKYRYSTTVTTDHEFDANVYDDEDFESEPFLFVSARDEDGEAVAKAYFGYHPDADNVVCWQVRVDPDHRRNGIATKMYAIAEEHFGEPLVPFPGGHSDDAKKFWGNRE